MTRRLLPWILLAGALVAGGIAVWILRGQVRREALARDRAEARADVQSQILGAELKRILQLEPRLDAIDRALKSRTTIQFSPVIRFQPIEKTAETPVTVDSADVRHARLEIDDDSLGLEGSVAVAAPAPPQPARWSLQLGIKPIQPVFRVRCAQDAGAGGVRRAYLTADSLPPWARIELGLPQADPEVCSPSPPAFGFRLNAPTLVVAGGAGLLGLLVGIFAF